MRVVAQVPNGLDFRLMKFISLITNAYSEWLVEEVTPTEEERAVFNGRQIVRTPPELSAGPDSSGVAGDELSVISSSTSASGSIRAEQEREAALARALRAEARNAVLEEARTVYEARIAALEEQIRRQGIT